MTVGNEWGLFKPYEEGEAVIGGEYKLCKLSKFSRNKIKECIGGENIYSTINYKSNGTFLHNLIKPLVPET